MSSSIFSLLQIDINYYVIPTITILGEIGNIFIVILFSRRRRQNSCATFLLWAAVMNNVTITFSTIYIISIVGNVETQHFFLLLSVNYASIYLKYVFRQLDISLYLHVLIGLF
jgi:ABC-type Fe3+-siderophore transport system permease subunit